MTGSHSFNGIYGYTSLSGSSGYPDGVYHNVALVSSGNNYKGAAATVTVVGGTVTDVVISDPGSGYVSGETLVLDLLGWFSKYHYW